ncbi:MAG TPA: gluconolactonase [Cryomorphaceae bacterium]|mgnify:CR=1 FL=1|nr:gluconolactonase [Owenweeksia sp.]MBF97889.1 gluconolactonase [Owenweeksia sp.]HAD97913.1 gluconolactonase [Cryomorphaceae bacterium]HBF21977.1 gluconolactonase [Cryomorphaceae bacterium]|tara:strand:- start:17 stop:922 length:906 start_codon:yes stop_codon:yes gene_type:complete
MRFFVLPLVLCLKACQPSEPQTAVEQQGHQLFEPGEKPQKLAGGFLFTEGPARDSSGNVFFTDQPNNQIWVWTIQDSLQEFADSSGRANGLYFGPAGYLYACSDANNEIWRFDREGNSQVVLDHFEDKSFNGPNDLWINSEGGIYFTDPYYRRDYWTGIHPENPVKGVYYLAPGAKEAQLVASGFERPNGIVGSERDSLLYVSDIDLDSTFSFRILPDNTLTNRKALIPMESDGMTLDEKGNLYLTGNGVTVFDPSGNKLAHIPIPEKWTGNVCFGGKNNKTLFITASTGLYALPMKIKGL